MKTPVCKEDIRIGIPLQCNIYDRRRRLLLKQGLTIDSQAQLDAVLARGAYFIPEEDLQIQLANRRYIFSGTSFALIDEAHTRLESLYEGETLKKNFVPGIIRLCKQIQHACNQDRDSSLGTILWQQDAPYSIKHAVHAAIACEIILRGMGYPENERLSVLAAALTMNVAMSRLQDSLFFQKASISQDQRRLVYLHIMEGMGVLAGTGVSDPLWLQTVLQHHELPNGTGYPQKLTGEVIAEPSRVLTIADIYCAKVTGRAYRKPLTSNIALKEILLQDRGHSFDEYVAQMFIKEMGIYPPGSYVRLANREIAVVIRNGEKPTSPVVRSIMRPNGDPFLHLRMRNTAEKEFAIIDVLPPSAVKFNPNRLDIWNAGA